MKKIVVATTNPGKIREIKQILTEYELVTLKDINCDIDVIEDGETFKDNALKKAREICKAVNMDCIADDSGLCIDEYDGWPGVYTARFLGEGTTPEQRNEYILNRMKGLPREKRLARHCVCIAFVTTDGKEIVVQAETEGHITEAPRGKNDFGFDPIFELDTGKTYAEILPEEKNVVSSRRKALEMLKEKFKEIL